MISPVVEQYLREHGLLEVARERARGNALGGLADGLERADLLALGAAADFVRRLEHGDVVRVFVPAAPPPQDDLLVFSSGDAAGGTALARKIALSILLGPPGRRILFDWGALGLDLAQVVLSFGVTDLAGPLASRKSLLLAKVEDTRRAADRAKVSAFVTRAGFQAVFVETGADSASSPRSAIPALTPRLETP